MIDPDQIQVAQALALQAHDGQTDHRGNPYWWHLANVASLVPETTDMQITAWLHDAVEDTWVTSAHISDAFGHDIAEAVRLLTRETGTSYHDYVEAIADAPGRAGEIARAVKVADLHDHLATLHLLDREIQERLRRRYVAAAERLDPAALPEDMRA